MSTQRWNKNESVGKSTQLNNADLGVYVQKVVKKINSPASAKASSLSIVMFSGLSQVKFMQIFGTRFLWLHSILPTLWISPRESYFKTNAACPLWTLAVVSYWDALTHCRQTLVFPGHALTWQLHLWSLFQFGPLKPWSSLWSLHHLECPEGST